MDDKLRLDALQNNFDSLKQNVILYAPISYSISSSQPVIWRKYKCLMYYAKSCTAHIGTADCLPNPTNISYACNTF